MMSNLHGCLETQCQGMRSILKPVSHPYVIWGVFVPVSFSQTEGCWICSPNSGKPQRDIKAGGRTGHKCVCMHIDTHTHTHTHPVSLSVPYEGSKRHKLTVIKQNEGTPTKQTDKEGEQVIGDTGWGDINKCRGERDGGERRHSHVSQSKWGHYTHEPFQHREQRMSPEANQITSGCSCEPIATAVRDIRRTVGFKPGNMIYCGNVTKVSWKSRPYWIKPWSLCSCAPVSSAISLSGVREGLLFMPQIQFGSEHRNQVQCRQLETLCKQQMFSLSRGTQHLASVWTLQNIDPKRLQLSLGETMGEILTQFKSIINCNPPWRGISIV